MEDLHFHIRDGINNMYELHKFIDNGKAIGINKFCMLEHGNRISPKHFGYLDSFEAIDEMKKSISLIKKNNKDVEILSGIEIDYSNNLNFRKRTLELIEYGHFDLVIGGIHSFNFDDGSEYFNFIIDMINNYPINVIAHFKLRDNWIEYKETIEKVVLEASRHNTMIEINTSDRSLWNEEQFDFMMDILIKYNCSYTCGSDSHHSCEIGTNYDILERRLKKRGFI